MAAGDIVLLHDGHARRSAGDQPVVLDVLPRLLQHCAQLGLQSITLRAAVPPRASEAPR
jgi:peptidoglycan/xylan/chitin deacetylase (PgdA/CDA1 family)